MIEKNESVEIFYPCSAEAIRQNLKAYARTQHKKWGLNGLVYQTQVRFHRKAPNHYGLDVKLNPAGGFSLLPNKVGFRGELVEENAGQTKLIGEIYLQTIYQRTFYNIAFVWGIFIALMLLNIIASLGVFIFLMTIWITSGILFEFGVKKYFARNHYQKLKQLLDETGC